MRTAVGHSLSLRLPLMALLWATVTTGEGFSQQAVPAPAPVRAPITKPTNPPVAQPKPTAVTLPAINGTPPTGSLEPKVDPAAPMPILANPKSDKDEGGNDDEPDTAGEIITAERIDAEKKQALASPDLTDEQKTAITETYAKALEELKSYQASSERIATYDQTIKDAPERLAKRKAKIGSPFTDFPLDPKTMPVPELEQKLALEIEKLKNSEKKAQDLEAEPKRRDDKTREIGEHKATAFERKRKLREELDADPPEGEVKEQTTARKTLLKARLQAIDQLVAANQKELDTFKATSEVLPIDRDLAIRTVTRYHQRIEMATKAINERRSIDAENQAREAELAARNAANLNPLCQEIANENAAYARDRKPLIQKIGNTTSRLGEMTPSLTKLKLRSKLIREKVDTGGLSEQTGEILRKQQQEMPNLDRHRKNIAKAHEELTKTQLEVIDYDARRTELVDVNSLVDGLMQTLGPETKASEHAHFRRAATTLLDAQRVYVDTLIADSKSYVAALTDLIETENTLLQEAEMFSDYIAERILWVKSGSPVDSADFANAVVAAKWLVAPENWQKASEVVVKDVLGHLPLYIASGLVLLLLFVVQTLGRRRLRKIGEAVKRNYVDTTPLTVYALFLTCIVASVWPLAIGFTAWRLMGLAGDSSFVGAVGSGLQMVAVTLFAIQVLRQMCRHNGLADAHFRWKTKSLRIIRRNLYGLLVTEIPLVFVVAVLESWRATSSDPIMSHSLGRFAFIAGMLVLARFTQRMFTPKDGVLQDLLANLQGGWMDRGRVVLYPVAVLTPIVLSVIAALGYYYSAQKTAERLLATVLLGTILIMVNAVMLRWLFAVRGRLAMDQAKKRRAAEQQAEAEGTPVPDTAIESDEPDLSKINLQTRTLLRSSVGFGFLVGLWLIWAQIMPALKMLEQIEFWPYAVMVTETVKGPNGEITKGPDNLPLTHTVERIQRVDLADVIKALVLILMTVIAAQNIPGLLEITLLARLPLDAGGRYATAKLASYVIVILGILLVANQVGMSWSNVQWLAAAVSVGLGFGLQEIFANFVSGLIILFERPIRVGDLVTVRDHSGTIAKIRIRATTIVDSDRKEVIVPNKAFITDQIVNWTLTDRMIRASFEIVVAHGTDTALTRELLLRAALEHPKVMRDPGPSASFDGIGESTLRFSLRVFVANIDELGSTKHEINTAINNLFREHGISTSSPHKELLLVAPPKALTMFEPESRSA